MYTMGLKNKTVLAPERKLRSLIKACVQFGGDTGDGKITKTKLAKLVYLSDFTFFYENLKPISGVTYRKFHQGPVSCDFFDQLTSLLATQDLSIEAKGKAHMVSINKKDTKSDLSKKELELVKRVCEKWKDIKTKEIVDFTHEQIPWKISFKDREVPYSLIIQQNPHEVY